MQKQENGARWPDGLSDASQASQARDLMITYDPEQLLQPISDAQPCGANLEYDPEFQDLQRRASALDEEPAVGPDSIEAPPDWAAIGSAACKLLARTKDVRIAVVLIKALLHVEGPAGLNRGLALLDALLERYWSPLHPELGSDAGSALERCNALRELCDLKGVIWPLRASALLRPPGREAVTFRELSAGRPLELPELCRPQLQVACATIKQTRSGLRAIETRAQQAPASEPLRLEALASLLEQIERALGRISEALGPQLPEAGPLQLAEPGAPAVALPVAGSRGDVVRILDGLCGYYAHYEPSSPIPILLRRAKRLVSMQFIDVIRDLAPTGLAEIESLRGPITTEES